MKPWYPSKYNKIEKGSKINIHQLNVGFTRSAQESFFHFFSVRNKDDEIS